ncbi:MAG: Hsp70 family protein [Deltaproteobacteria bacterium]|nr:Hsp70 family protein [Deltaproteobacteria bacterium]
MAPIIGIDLGTSNTCFAFHDGGKVTVVPAVDGKNTMPSVVHRTTDGKWITGAPALRYLGTAPERTFTAVKRLVGRRFLPQELAAVQPQFGYRLVSGPDREPLAEVNGERLRLEEIQAVLLSEVKSRASDVAGEEVREAVLTVPAFFTEKQRAALRDAGRIAGLLVRKIVSEPTAAAVAYGLGRGANKRVLVFDLGGGTFDITVIEAKEGNFTVIATDGDTQLGGEDFDNRLVDYLADLFLKKYPGIDLRKDPASRARVKEAAERAKCELSTAKQSAINLPFITVIDGQPVHFEGEVTRSLLEGTTDMLVLRAVKIVERVLANQNLKKENLDEILMVGGMTRMPKILATAEKVLGRPPSRGVNPDEAVAIGAATIGQWISEAGSRHRLTDVVPLPLGLTAAGNRMSVLIDRNTPTPAEAKKVFTTSRDGQDRIKIHVRQGEHPEATQNELLGAFNLMLSEPGPKGTAKIEVEFRLDDSGILTVAAHDTATGSKQEVVIEPGGETDTSGVADNFESARNRMARFGAIRKQLEQVEELIRSFSQNIQKKDRDDIEEKLRRARAAIVLNDLARAETLVKSVGDAAMKFYERLDAASSSGAPA